MRSWIIAAVCLGCLSATVTRADDVSITTPVPAPTRVDKPAEVVPILERFQSVVGIFAILGLVTVLSTNRRAISPRVVIWGLLLQWAFALIVLRVPLGRMALERAGDAIKAMLDCALVGSAFVFGEKLTAPDGPAGFVFAFRVLPTVVFVAALFAVLYHIGVMQWVVRVLAIGMEKLMGASGAESLNVAASLFLGQTEAPLTIRPYLPRLTQSELLTVMTSGMAHVSGGVMAAYFAFGVEPRHVLTAVIMTAPGTILLSKLLIPETEIPETAGNARPDALKPDANLLDAASRGTREGLQLALNIAAMLISFLALIAFINLLLSTGFPSPTSVLEHLTTAGSDRPIRWISLPSLERIFGSIFAPVAYLLGIPWRDCGTVGSLLGTRTVLNELIAFGRLPTSGLVPGSRSFTITTYALCGFANFSSIGIQLGGIGALAPERRTDLARLGFRALLAGTLANFLSACIAGILL